MSSVPHSVYPFTTIERKWQAYWAQTHTFAATQGGSKPSYYVLDMFPYPSGAGLHVGHPLGYVATDIMARYHWSKGYNVLHPMGFDAFGLPAEQYAVETGQHPATTTGHNIARYKEQLQGLGLAFDWEREVRTSDPAYYRWTQWIFVQLFESWYDNAAQQARPIAALADYLAKKGNATLAAACDADTPTITAAQWGAMSPGVQQVFLGHYRLAYRAETMVNWCPVLGTVLANEEVKDGLSERGGHPVVRKRMPQWSLRITAYAERLLGDLEALDWPKAIKESQRHWIGRSEGMVLSFALVEEEDTTLEAFTTRPDTLFGVTYLALAAEHPLIEKLVAQDPHLAPKIAILRNKAPRARQQDTPQGCFTGYHVCHPLTGKPLPLWVADYVLPTYGQGAVMGVPAHDARDYAFATHFGLPIVAVIQPHDSGTTLPFEGRAGMMIGSDFLNGLSVPEALATAMNQLETKGVGQRKVGYKLHDATFSRQRYWGEPIPIYYQEGVPYALPEEELPLTLPVIDNYRPTPTGEPPLARVQGWRTKEGHPLEHTTMPGWAGSSWYFLRYMDPHAAHTLAAKEMLTYWDAVDLYMGGAEHATGHLLYARFYTKFLYDRGHLTIQEPFKHLVNQGMIQGVSHLAYRIKGTQQFVSHGLKDKYDTTPFYVDLRLIKDATRHTLDIGAFKEWRSDLAGATFVLEGDDYICGHLVEKMSKSKYNTLTPDEVIADYGADTLRLYLMFLGPIAQSKPWNIQGIEGVHRFLHKVWRLFYDTQGQRRITQEVPTTEEHRTIYATTQQVEEHLTRLAFNTAISALMVGVNTLTTQACHKQAILDDLVRLLAPFAPHLAEELWEALGHQGSILQGGWPTYQASLLTQEEVIYPLAVNGKKRATLTLPTTMGVAEVQQAALAHPTLAKWLAGKQIAKVVVVPQRMVNVVVH